MDAHEIRTRFIEFFEARAHTHVRSSSLVPEADPTLLFVNAGMVQFKDTFLGREQRDYKRAVSVQRCVRAGGKHNDLDNVGHTPRHHTLFEMLGNFSFGDYFKKDAIAWAWEFLTKTLAIDPKRLVVTVFDGTGENAEADEEAAKLWEEWVPAERIYRCGAKDNFWMMGDTGPCGPCSEIHIFHGDEAPGEAGVEGKGPAHEEDRYMELWNLVFMQYDKQSSGELVPLPNPCVDTGAGLERLAATVAGVRTNYETDLLKPLVGLAKELAGDHAKDAGDAPFQVIADHARAASFLIADGVFPDKAGRSYVLRRIMRRAIRYGTEVGLSDAFMDKMCAKVVADFGAAYPELKERAAVIQEVVAGEEEAFRRTLDRGLKRVRGALEELGDTATAFPPEVAADLYDTYGFPLDLTGVICREWGLELDEEAADAVVRERQAGGAGGDIGHTKAIATVYFDAHAKCGDTTFTGYNACEGQARVAALIVDGVVVQQATAGQQVEVISDSTPFYAESGGQIGDAGRGSGDGWEVTIEATTKPVAGLHVHRGELKAGTVRVGDKVRWTVDTARRDAIRRNHSATHLLHHALREVLGEHVTQKGSLVAPDRLRFDFSHKAPLSREERAQVEQRVHAQVLANLPTDAREMGMDAARAEGAMMLFGEKYGDQVRVVRIGEHSVELCGGTHVGRSGDIGSFIITLETGVAQGVRRIEARTGLAAFVNIPSSRRAASAAVEILHAPGVVGLPEAAERVLGEVKAKAREVLELQRELLTGGAGDDDSPTDVDGVKLLAKRVNVADAKALRDAADALRGRLGTGVVVLGAEQDGKATLLVAATSDLKARVHAGKLVATLAAHVDGRGGGRPDMAQAGGPNAAGLDAAIGAASDALAAQLRA